VQGWRWVASTRRRGDVRRRARAARASAGYDTSWIRATATVGLLPGLGRNRRVPALDGCQRSSRIGDGGFHSGYVAQSACLVFSGLYPASKLHESPIFQKMKAEGKGSKSPLTDSFFKYPNNKYVLASRCSARPLGRAWVVHGQF